MSAAHVRLLNEHLSQVPAVREACARLPRDVSIAHHLTDEHGGPDVWWHILYSRREGTRLALGEPAGPVDAVFEGGYWAMLEQTEAAIRGRSPSGEAVQTISSVGQIPPGLAEAMAVTAEVHALCWAEGLKFDVDFPKRTEEGSSS